MPVSLRQLSQLTLCVALLWPASVSAQSTDVWRSLSDYLPEDSQSLASISSQGNTDIEVLNRDIAALLKNVDLTLQNSAAIKAGDAVFVTVKNVESLSGLYTVDRNGFLKLPHIQAVKAAGRSAAQITASISALYRNGLLRDPEITVDTQSESSGKIVISGAVMQAGVVDINRYKQLTDVIEQVNGLTANANKNSFIVFRVEAGQRKIYAVNYQRVLDRLDYDPVIGPQDIIYVPKINEALDPGSLKASLNVLDLALDLAVK